MNAPEKIYGWLDTQLSIARHYGGIKFRGESYLIDYDNPDHPLVRQDVLLTESKAKKQLAKEKRKQEKAKQGDIWTKSE